MLYIAFEGDDSAIQWCQFCVSLSGSLFSILQLFASFMVYSVPTGQVVPTSCQVVDSTCECSGVSTTDFYQLTGSVQLKLLNYRCSTKLPLPRNPPLLET